MTWTSHSNFTDCDVTSTDSKQGVCIIAKLMPGFDITSLGQNRERRGSKVLYSIKETVENFRSGVKDKGNEQPHIFINQLYYLRLCYTPLYYFVNQIIQFSDLKCPKSFESKENGGYFFCYHSKKVAYENAKQRCISNGLRIVEIYSEAKSMSLDSFASKDYAWLGLVCPSKSDDCLSNFDLWVWENSKTKLVDTSGWKSRYYKRGSIIAGGGSGEYCSHWWHKKNGKSQWAPQTCSSRGYGTLCEKGIYLLNIH